MHREWTKLFTRAKSFIPATLWAMYYLFRATHGKGGSPWSNSLLTVGVSESRFPHLGDWVMRDPTHWVVWQSPWYDAGGCRPFSSRLPCSPDSRYGHISGFRSKVQIPSLPQQEGTWAGGALPDFKSKDVKQTKQVCPANAEGPGIIGNHLQTEHPLATFHL